MKTFDEDFGQVVLRRLGDVPENAAPAWGKMTRGQAIGHLEKVLRYTLGGGPDVPFKGNAKTRYLFKHVILLGLREIPHNVRAAAPKGVSQEQMFAETPLEDLEAAIQEYLARAKTGDLPPRMHPYFGILTGPQWQRFHRLHTIHHLKQFRVGDGL